MGNNDNIDGHTQPASVSEGVVLPKQESTKLDDDKEDIKSRILAAAQSWVGYSKVLLLDRRINSSLRLIGGRRRY
jgi:hypothetical protein